MFTFSNDSVECNKEISTCYQIGDGTVEIKTAQEWWTIVTNGQTEWGDYTSHDDYLAQQEITSVMGTSCYCPKYGNEIYFTVCGELIDGRPFYAESKHITIESSSQIISLPSYVKRIESEAFSGIQANEIVIPDSIEFIAEDAFENSGITTIISSCEYCQQYALNHNLIYIEK